MLTGICIGWTHQSMHRWKGSSQAFLNVPEAACKQLGICIGSSWPAVAASLALLKKNRNPQAAIRDAAGALATATRLVQRPTAGWGTAMRNRWWGGVQEASRRDREAKQGEEVAPEEVMRLRALGSVTSRWGEAVDADGWNGFALLGEKGR